MKNKHNFSDKHPVLSLLIFTFGGFLVAEFIIGMIFMFALESITGLDATTSVSLGGAIGSLFVLIIWYRWFSPEYRFMPQKGEIKDSFRLLWPILIYWVIVFGIYGYFAGGIPFRIVGIQSVAVALLAGLAEEVCFREIALSFMAKKFLNEKRIPLFAIVSGTLFGLTHLSNLAGGSPLTDILYQVLLCILSGVFYSAVYLRKGNVWVLCLVHFVHDLLALMAVKGVKDNGVESIPDFVAVCIVIIEAALCVYGFYLLRKSRRGEITGLWNRKWSRL
ncbi:MAG: CPBP family intramembrane metalloprotease [Lachnospiraceae bacterium]|nr:CPBP family intramembrane metalloprotease [Lachnospiraceae bacterium]